MLLRQAQGGLRHADGIGYFLKGQPFVLRQLIKPADLDLLPAEELAGLHPSRPRDEPLVPIKDRRMEEPMARNAPRQLFHIPKIFSHARAKLNLFNAHLVHHVPPSEPAIGLRHPAARRGVAASGDAAGPDAGLPVAPAALSHLAPHTCAIMRRYPVNSRS
jgi:hypothetical protein